MKKVVTTRVAADGVLTLTVLLGEGGANRDVRVTVETVEESVGPPTPAGTREEWLQFIAATAGKWRGDLARPPQGEYEKRDEWP